MKHFMRFLQSIQIQPFRVICHVYYPKCMVLLAQIGTEVHIHGELVYVLAMRLNEPYDS